MEGKGREDNNQKTLLDVLDVLSLDVLDVLSLLGDRPMQVKRLAIDDQDSWLE